MILLITSMILHKKEDLSQVNPQLYEWLAIVNDKSSNNSIPDSSEKVNTSDEEIQFSREAGDRNTVTMTRGEVKKRDANYKSDKVYSKSETEKALFDLVEKGGESYNSFAFKLSNYGLTVYSQEEILKIFSFAVALTFTVILSPADISTSDSSDEI